MLQCYTESFLPTASRFQDLIEFWAKVEVKHQIRVHAEALKAVNTKRRDIWLGDIEGKRLELLLQLFSCVLRLREIHDCALISVAKLSCIHHNALTNFAIGILGFIGFNLIFFLSLRLLSTRRGPPMSAKLAKTGVDVVICGAGVVGVSGKPFHFIICYIINSLFGF